MKFVILFFLGLFIYMGENKFAVAIPHSDEIIVPHFSCIDFDRTKFSQEQIDSMNESRHFQLINEDPLYDIKRVEYEQQIQNEINRGKINRQAQSVITIPVVVHVLYNTPIQNISATQILSQITVLNEDFARTNADTINTPLPFRATAANTGIQFCLAQHDPFGNPSTGIERRQTSITVYNSTNGGDVKFYSLGGLDQWDPTKYMNIWVCNNNFGAYGEFPLASTTNTYGIVLPYFWFGNTGIVSPPQDLGRTTTHEIGHCLNLYHIWGDDNGACTGTDYCNDTPNQADANIGCFAFPHFDGCTPTGNGTMFDNYMDYTDDNCKNIFTQDQSARMNAVLNIPPYNALATSNGCQPVTLTNDNSSISSIITPQGNVCPTFIPKIVLKNWGANNLTSCTIEYYTDTNIPVIFNWNGNLSSLATDTISFPAITLPVGTHTFTAKTNLPNSNTDSNPANDSLTSFFNVQGAGIALPFFHGFESLYFVPAGWTLNNSDNYVTWVRTTTAAKTGNASALMNNLAYQNGNGQQDEMVLPSLDLTSVPNPVLAFDVAYTYYNQTNPPLLYTDTLTVLISVDCGQSFSVIYKKGGAQLATSVPIPNGPFFIPTIAEWRKEYISLANYQTDDNAIIKIRNTSGWGNSLYLDNINLDDALSLNSLDLYSSISLYPNPTNGNLFIDFGTASNENINIKIYDLFGRNISEIEKSNFIGGTIIVDLSNEANGIYFVQVKTDYSIFTKKVLIDRK